MQHDDFALEIGFGNGRAICQLEHQLRSRLSHELLFEAGHSFEALLLLSQIACDDARQLGPLCSVGLFLDPADRALSRLQLRGGQLDNLLFAGATQQRLHLAQGIEGRARLAQLGGR